MAPPLLLPWGGRTAAVTFTKLNPNWQSSGLRVMVGIKLRVAGLCPDDLSEVFPSVFDAGL